MTQDQPQWNRWVWIPSRSSELSSESSDGVPFVRQALVQELRQIEAKELYLWGPSHGQIPPLTMVIPGYKKKTDVIHSQAKTIIIFFTPPFYGPNYIRGNPE